MDWKDRESFKPFGTQREYHWIRNLRCEDRRMAHSIADTSNAAGAASLFIADNGGCSASYNLIMEPFLFQPLEFRHLNTSL